MTETQLRQFVVDTALGYLDTQEGSARHAEILAIYNAQRPLPRSYPVKAWDAWCATFVSAIALKCGLTDIMPTECGCPSMIRLYQNLGRWMEDDAYIPSPGDVIFYDWQDSGNGDNMGQADHVGIVTACDGQTMTIIEGNLANAVKLRTLAVNAKFIRGFGLPDYAKRADEVGAEPEPEPEEPEEPKQEEKPMENEVDPFITAKAKEVIAGKWGNGQARRDALAQWFVDAVQAEVNRLLA